MKYIIRRSTQFKRDVKRLLKSGKDIEKLLTPIEVLAEGKALAPEYKDHPLKGQYIGKWYWDVRIINAEMLQCWNTGMKEDTDCGTSLV